ncbi:MAG TPA: UrcA family protein [Rhizomicrobium sp.]|nr:UrcA family protein [Rhizomicrobium sp.]
MRNAPSRPERRSSRTLAASALLLAGASLFAAPALAQVYGSPNDAGNWPAPAYERAPAVYEPGGEQVIVAAPRRRERSSVTGAPIVDVAWQRGVRFDDLDLTTAQGAHALRERVRITARELCRRLDAAYPIGVPGSPPCYRTAVDDALAQADAAIADARGYGD